MPDSLLKISLEGFQSCRYLNIWGDVLSVILTVFPIYSKSNEIIYWFYDKLRSNKIKPDLYIEILLFFLMTITVMWKRPVCYQSQLPPIISENILQLVPLFHGLMKIKPIWSEAYNSKNMTDYLWVKTPYVFFWVCLGQVLYQIFGW